ncbi:hypothetical protein GDO81_027559 [Engystomops pustulosus]|uniref:NACHT domain-containing protein n=1 Tax=Engystomops pustulosus TaxID=76066 RepID=A0AAV6ZKA4_ENGPU|nr:hypothetical protein GDO81_027559 [Engystomops pustulosus]
MKKTQNLVEHNPPRCNLEQKSFNISERFVNLVVVSYDSFRQRSQDELIHTGMKHEDYIHKAQRGLEFIAPSRLFGWCRRLQCVPHIVMVSGIPGVGKSTLLQKFVYDWVNSKLCKRFAFIFYFKFRDLNHLVDVKVSLEQMILHEYPYLDSHIDIILKDPKKLLFIFDGLDESVHKIDLKSRRFCTNPKYLENLDTIVVSLVRQVLLEGCSVLITSRPAKLSSIDTNAFHRIVEIMGFFNEERQMYFKQFFGNDEDKTQKVLNYLTQNDTLYTFCYIPSFCWIVCTVLSKCFQPQSKNYDQNLLPKTITQLFVTFVANILSNHSQYKDGADEFFRSIGKMAEYGVMNHILIFQEMDLRTFNVDINAHLLSSFVVESEDHPNSSFSFLHLTIQEFFAALVHYLDFSKEKLDKALEDAISCKDCRGEIFLRFLCGLSDGSTSSMLSSFIGDLSIQTSISVITWLRSFISDIFSDEKYKGNKRRFMYVLFYLFETRNKALISESLGSNRSFDFSGFHLIPLNCAALAYILEACRETENLDLKSSNIKIDGLERLAPVLHTVKDLSLYMNSLENGAIRYISSALSHTECRIQSLNLGFSGLADGSWSDLASAIRCNQSLRSLNLTSNKLEGPYFGDLVSALSSSSCKIEELNLSDTGLTDVSSVHLTSLITRTRSLRNLDLSYNRLDGPHFPALITALSRPDCGVEELVLRSIDLTSASCSLLAAVIRDNQSLRKLDLSANNLCGPQFDDLMAALSRTSGKIEELLLDNTGMTDASCIHLASAIQNNPYLRRLDLSDNRMAGPHFCHMMAALSSPDRRLGSEWHRGD